MDGEQTEKRMHLDKRKQRMARKRRSINQKHRHHAENKHRNKFNDGIVHETEMVMEP